MAISQTGSNWGESHFWQWQGLRCHWRVIGKYGKPPLVLIHGFGASSAHWRNNASIFSAAGFRVYGIDLVGFGKSDQPGLQESGPIDNRFWAKQVSAFLDEIVETKRFGKAVLVGNSLGGLAALTSGVRNPEMVSAVIAAPLPDPALMSPMKYKQPRWRRRLKVHFLTLLFRLFPLELIIGLIAKTNLIKIALQAAYCKSIKSDKELQRLVTHPARRPNAAKSLRAMCIGMATRPRSITVPALLERLSNRNAPQPILLLWGRKDKFVPLSIGKRLQDQYPWLNLVILESTGHCPHDESPKEFNKNVLMWLARNLESAQQQA